jgi:hypothetical protein
MEARSMATTPGIRVLGPTEIQTDDGKKIKGSFLKVTQGTPDDYGTATVRAKNAVSDCKVLTT